MSSKQRIGSVRTRLKARPAPFTPKPVAKAASTDPAGVGRKVRTESGVVMDTRVADGPTSIPQQLYIVPSGKAGPVVRIVRTWQLLPTQSVANVATTNVNGGYIVKDAFVYDMIAFNPKDHFPDWAKYAAQYQEFKVGKMTIEICPTFTEGQLATAAYASGVQGSIVGALHSSIQPGGKAIPTGIPDIMSDSEYMRTRITQRHVRQYQPKIIQTGSAQNMGSATTTVAMAGEGNPWISMPPADLNSVPTYNGLRVAFDPIFSTAGSQGLGVQFQVYCTCSMYFRINL